MSRLLFIILLSAFSINGWTQETLTLKYFGLAIHPLGDATAELQPLKLDKKARFVVNAGIFVGYEKFIYDDLFSIKAIQGITSDCSFGLASISHLGVRALLLKTKKHRIYFGIGPTLIIRDSWNRFGDDYNSSGYFNDYHSKKLGDLQWKFIPYAFEFEYDYYFTEKNQLSLSFTPGFPAMTIAVGWKHWFNIPNISSHKIFIPKKNRRL